MSLTLPYFKMDVIDWLKSERIEAMSNACIGAYILLLCEAWTRPDCSLPSAQARAQALARWQGTPEEFLPVMACFVPLKGRADRIINRRLKDEWDKTRAMSCKLSAAGKRGAQIKHERHTAPAVIPPRTRTPRVRLPKATDAEWLEQLKQNPAYRHINWTFEFGKMDAWFSKSANQKRQRTPSFILNWLNKIEAPLTPNGGAQRPPPPPPKNDPIGRGQWKQVYGKPEDHGYE